MLGADAILQAIPQALDKFEVPGDLPHGKVYDFYVTADGKRRVLIATDRLTIFDQQVGLVPYKGQALNELSAWSFRQTEDIIPNHLEYSPDPNVLIVREARSIPLVVVVRGYITGMTPTSLWTRYAAGEREIYGFKFPSGLKKNDPLPHPIVTPTTKSTVGHEDRQPLTNVVENRYLSAAEWEQVQAVALALFKRGQEMAARGGLILVDSKYEFGYDAEIGSLMLVDELHTPESSRYWKADTYADHVATGYEPHNLDRELARLWYATRAYDLKKPLPPISDDLIVSISRAYQQVYEMMTGQPFQPAAYPIQDRIHALLTKVV